MDGTAGESLSNQSTRGVRPRLVDILPADVMLCELWNPSGFSPLHPSEAFAVRNAGRQRRFEFATGRSCARSILRRIGIIGQPILKGPGGEPIWPDGLIGSITHTSSYCGAAIAFTTRYQAIGIDAEEADAVTSDLWPLLFLDREMEFLNSQPSEMQTELASVMFSCKEAFYKCQYPISKNWLDFLDVEVKIENEIVTVDVIKKNLVPRNIVRAYGGFKVGCSTVLTGIWVG